MRKICFLLLIILVTSCENDSKRNSSLISLVPHNASVVIKTSSLEGLISVFKNNSFLSQFADQKPTNTLTSKLDYLKYLKPSDRLLISFGRDKKDSLQISVITKYHKDLFNIDSVANRTVETITLKDKSIVKTTLDQTIIYSIIKDSIFFASSDRSLTESAFDEKNPNPAYQQLTTALDTEKPLSLFIDTNNSNFPPQIFQSDSLNKAPLTHYYMLDADFTQDKLMLHGITVAKDSSKSLINVFKNTLPENNQMAKIAPASSDGFTSITFDKFKNFHKNLLYYRSQDSVSVDPVFESVMEIGTIYKNKSQASVLNSIDAANMTTFLGQENSLETYRDVTIFSVKNADLFSETFSPFITYSGANYINLDDFFIFSDDVEFLKEIINSYQNNNTLQNSDTFQELTTHLSSESSLLIYANDVHLKQILDASFEVTTNFSAEGFKTSAVQYVYETDFAHVHAVLQKVKKNGPTNSVNEHATVKLDANLYTNPQFVNNHTNNEKEVVVQDVKNNLYLISKDGKVLWKKQLDGKILGRIEQMDIYKNGRLQLVFATQHRVYVIDRAGKDTGPFPLKFNDDITQPLAVFDYDKNRDYRLLVTQGKSLLMYDKRGKNVSGFTYKKAPATINTKPEHFRIGNKDYIVFVQGNELEILNRVGKTRVNIKNNISFSGSGLFLYDNLFTTTSINGDLVQIDEKGKLASSKLNLGEKHHLTATNKTLVTLSENILTIKTHKIELDFGDYTAPVIFYVNDKIYISLTDLQAKKVYLFDSLGKSIPNFPVYGNSRIDLDNIDNGQTPEIVTKGGDDSIIIYQIN